MNDPTLDPRRQMLVAALYGELDAESRDRLQELLAGDPQLRSEWEELEDARTLLTVAEDPEDTPGFVFLEPPRATPRRPRVGILSGLLGSRGWRLTPAWGFAGVAVALVALVAAGLRVDWEARGVALRFGPAPVLVTDHFVPAEDASTGRGATVRTTTGARPTGETTTGPRATGTSGSISSPEPVSGSGTEGVQIQQVSQSGDLITREDLNEYSTVLLKTMAQAMGEAQTLQKRELALFLERFYNDLLQEQDRRYDDLRARVDGVGLGLLAEQSRTNARLTRLIEGAPAATSPDRGTVPPPQEPEEVEKP